MTTASSNPTPEHRRAAEKGQYPVLARLPDVSRDVPTRPRLSQAPAEFVDYRFDTAMGGGEEAAGTKVVTPPHVFQRAGRGERPHAFRRRPRALPDSNPFSIPPTSLYERFAPVVRFLTMFALFTVAGTTFLTYSGRNRAAGEGGDSGPRPTAPAPASARHSLQPETNDLERPVAPTATGPLGFQKKSAMQRQQASASKQLAAVPRLSRANGTPLPQVRTSEPRIGMADDISAGPWTQSATAEQAPPAMARLAPYILEAPSRQAQHDDNQPGLH